MRKKTNLVKLILAILTPSLLLALFIFQIYFTKSIQLLRNSYLLETLPPASDWVWNALSGSQSPGSSLPLRKIQEGSDIEIKNSDLSDLSKDGSGHNRKLLHEVKYSGSERFLRDNENYYKSVLLPDMPSMTVHYFWCIKGHFEMTHYISLLSIIHQLRPDKIVIHYLIKPRYDPSGYWRWLEDLQRSVAMLVLKPLQNPQFCKQNLSYGVKYDEEDFEDPHGVFIFGDVAIANLTRPDVLHLMLDSFFNSKTMTEMASSSNLGVEAMSKSQVYLVSDIEPYHIIPSPGRVVIRCPSVSQYDKLKTESDLTCFSMNSYIVPENLFRVSTRFYRFARNLMYGSPSPIESEVNVKDEIPNIVHIIFKEDIKDISPVMYASIKSAYTLGKVDQVYVHSPSAPVGPLWESLCKNIELCPILYIPISKPNSNQEAMVYALYTLLIHGGVAHFGDIIFNRPIPLTSRKASVIATQHYSQYRMKHRSINTVILGSVPGSAFIESLLSMVRQSTSSWPEARIDDMATHISEVNPTSVFLDSKLTSHHECKDGRCIVAGGHSPSEVTYTSRLIWKTTQPRSLEELKRIEGSCHNILASIINDNNTA